jgi:hypothetical protein
VTTRPLDGVGEYAWSEIRSDAIRRFGNQPPGGPLEAEIMEAFADAPAIVVGTIDAVAAVYAAGKVHSPWAIVRARLRDNAAPAELVVTDEEERERAIKRAENLLHAVGPHIELEREVVALLFTDAGERCGPVLGRWAGDQELEAQMLALWRELPKAAA